MRACEICAEPMVGGQEARHFTCCAAAGGRPDDPCNTTSETVNGRKVVICPHCWKEARP